MRKMMNLTALVCTLTLLAGAARAEEKTLAIVVKGLDNPFFDLIRQGCEKAQAELKDGYKCYYTGPASTSDEAGEVQIIDDLLTKGVAAMAISPSNSPAIANVLRQRKPTIPIMTIDADLLPQDHSLRRTYLGTDNYLLGVKLAEHLKAQKPNGGTLCLVVGNVAADNINQRAAGTRDTLAGKKGVERLNGENGWKEISGCPLFTNDDAAKGNQMMADVLTANKELDAFVLEGGWPQFAPQAYAQFQVLAQAITAAKTLNDDKLADYLRGHTFKTVIGDVAFGKDGEWAKPRMVFTQFLNVTGNAAEQVDFPVHVLAINALGVQLLDYLQFGELVPVCEEAGRWSFLCVVAPLRLHAGTGSPVNPIAIL